MPPRTPAGCGDKKGHRGCALRAYPRLTSFTPPGCDYLGSLDEFQSIPCRIDGDTNNDAGVAVWTRLTVHLSTRSFDRGDRCGHVLHVENPVSYTHLRAHETPE